MEQSNSGSPPPESRGLSWRFFLAIFFDMMTVAMVVPLLPQYCLTLGMSKSSLGFIQSIYGVMQTISTPVLGMLTDVAGPRPILMLSLVGTAVSYTILGAAMVDKSHFWFYVARILIGGTRQTMAVGAAVVTGVYAQGIPHGEARRKAAGKGMSWFSFATSFAFCVGPAIGGYLADQYGVIHVAFVATAVGLANAALMYTSVPSVIQETVVVPEKRIEVATEEKDESGTKVKSWRDRRTPIGFAFRVFKQCDHNSFLLVTMLLNSLSWVMIQSSLASMLGEVSRLEARAQGLDHQKLSMTGAGSVIALVSSVNAVTQFCLPGLLKKFPSYQIALVANCSACLGYAIQTQASASVSLLCFGLLISALSSGMADTVNKSTFMCSFESSFYSSSAPAFRAANTSSKVPFPGGRAQGWSSQ
jgi:MFS family permease